VRLVRGEGALMMRALDDAPSGAAILIASEIENYI
jgi:hypothetical protein